MQRVHLITYVAALTLLLSLSVSAPVMGQPKEDGSVPGITENPLTEQQKHRIAAIRLETEKEVAAVRNNSKLTQQEKTRQIEGIRKRGHERVMAELTPAQRQEFQEWWESRSETPPGVGRGPLSPRPPNLQESAPPTPDPSLLMLRKHPLTPEQKRQMEEIRIRSLEQAERTESSSELSDEQKTEMLGAIRRGAHEQFVDMLTMEQVEEMIDWLSGKFHLDPEERGRQSI